MRIHYLQHVAFEGPGNIAAWAIENGHTLACTRLYANEPLPAVQDFDWLVILGGPMNIYEHERYPWLVAEKAFIAVAIEQQRRVLGVCLGAQLIADVLGGRVQRNEHREIGWFPVALTPQGQESRLLEGFPDRFTPFHWHGDTFTIPPGAVHLAQSEACAHQAFQYGDRVLGLQFHLDYTWESVEAMVRHCSDELIPAPFVRASESFFASRREFDDAESLLQRLLTAIARA